MRLVFVSVLLMNLPSAFGQEVMNGRPSLVLKGNAAKLVVDLGGGSLVHFALTDNAVNPLTWDSKGDKSSPRAMGHFLCLDRWGQPSEAEQKNKMPFHGEAARVNWHLVKAPTKSAEGIQAEMSASLPLAGLEVKRRIELSDGKPFFIVTEAVTNLNKLGRIYNMVQHPTIGPPFLDEGTLVDANARAGFMQSTPLPNPERPRVEWPMALKGDQQVDLRRLTTDANPNVVSYVIESEYGWTTASSPSSGLLLGYIWRTADYPWLNIWRHVDNGKPVARGLEFGTTGLHQPFGVLVKKRQIFERPLFSYLDAGETTARSYASFLLRIPPDYRGVADISYKNGELRLTEHPGGRAGDLTIQVGNLFQ